MELPIVSAIAFLNPAHLVVVRATQVIPALSTNQLAMMPAELVAAIRANLAVVAHWGSVGLHPATHTGL